MMTPLPGGSREVLMRISNDGVCKHPMYAGRYIRGIYRFTAMRRFMDNASFRLSQCRAPLSPNQSAKTLYTILD
jgi:hypothetical protein